MRVCHALCWLLVAACSAQSSAEPDLGPRPVSKTAAAAPVASAPDLNPRLLRRFRPLRDAAMPQTPEDRARVELGKQLFFDPRLSRNGKIACSSCHSLENAGADPRRYSLGIDDKAGTRNAPTVLNAAWHIAQFWDGRASDIVEQAKGPILNPDEMAMRSPSDVVRAIAAIPGYVAAFKAAFAGEPLNFDQVAQAIAAFERTLATPARWDRFLGGDRGALTAAEVDGLKLFADVGCVQCHTGELVGASMFQRVGVAEPWPNQSDQGRAAVTHADADRMVFKVPSLRNVALTAPYFHDGSAATLEDAVRAMGHHQLGVELGDAEVASIVRWLKTLTGTMPNIAPPKLP